MNDTRVKLNNQLRAALGYRQAIPCDPAEKIICLQNHSRYGVRNGEFLSVACPIELELVTKDEVPAFKTIVSDESGLSINRDREGDPREAWIYGGHFLDHVALDLTRRQRDWKALRWLIEATFGYAITCHKAQGSQWDRVVVFDEMFGRTSDEMKRWLYTAVTRASEELLLVI